MDFEQCDCRFPNADSVLGNALVTAIITLTDILYGKISTIHYAYPATLQRQ
jgi:hypothetical protein